MPGTSPAVITAGGSGSVNGNSSDPDGCGCYMEGGVDLLVSIFALFLISLLKKLILRKVAQ